MNLGAERLKMGMGTKTLVGLDGDLEGQGGRLLLVQGASWLVCRVDHRCLSFASGFS